MMRMMASTYVNLRSKTSSASAEPSPKVPRKACGISYTDAVKDAEERAGPPNCLEHSCPQGATVNCPARPETDSSLMISTEALGALKDLRRNNASYPASPASSVSSFERSICSTKPVGMDAICPSR
jgi:hypothetical protein